MIGESSCKLIWRTSDCESGVLESDMTRDRSWHGQLNAEGIAAPPLAVLFNIATRRRNWVKVVQSRRWPFQRYCGNRAFNRVPAHENSIAGRRAVPETVPRTKEPRARSLRFCARVVWPLPLSFSFCHPFFSSFIPCLHFPSRSVSFSHCSIHSAPTLPISPLLFVHRLFVPDSWLHQMDTRVQFTQSTRARLGEWSASTCQSKAPQRCHVDKAIHDTIVKPLSRPRRDQHGLDLSSARFQWPLSKW